MTFYERYAVCCRKKGIAPVSQEAADNLGCTKSTISAFARNGNTPKGDIIAGAAKMLDVSADYLLGLIESPDPVCKEDQLTQMERHLLQMFRELNVEGQEAALAMIFGLSSQTIYKNFYSFELEKKKQA